MLIDRTRSGRLLLDTLLASLTLHSPLLTDRMRNLYQQVFPQRAFFLSHPYWIFAQRPD
jgi:hypothetical protein